MKNTKTVFRKTLSVLLTAVLLFGTVSLGIIIPETKITANAAQYNVSTIAQLKNAISSANTAGANTQTIIKLTASISVGETAALTAITGNVKLDLNGKNLVFEYTGSCGEDTSNYEYQLPSELQGTSVYNNSDYFETGIINVAAGGTLQIVNSTSTECTLKSRTYLTRNKGVEKSKNYYFQATSNLIYSEGNVIIGELNGANKFTIFSEAAVYCHTKTTDYAKCHVYTHSVAVTMNSTYGIFRMYGGTIESCASSRGKRDSGLRAICYGVYIVNAYCTEIYDGTISIPNVDECGLRNTDSTNTDEKIDSFFCALRVNVPHVYIFKLNSKVEIYVGADTEKAHVSTANIYSTNNVIPYIYGGEFENTSSGSTSDAGQCHNYTVLGEYSYAADGSMFAGTKAGAVNGTRGLNYAYHVATPTVNMGTLFYFGDDKTFNGVYPWGYATFRDYRESNPSSNDVYFSASASHMNDGGNYSATNNNFSYLRLGYTHVGWNGTKTHGTSAGSSSQTTCPTNGSLFLFPKWQINDYTITYDLNDSTGNNTASLPSGSPTTYRITSTSSLPAPTRPGYKFDGWEASITFNDYLQSDRDILGLAGNRPWQSGTVYDAGTPLTDKVGNVTLIAKWTENTYTATFNLNGGNIGGNSSFVTKEYTVNSTFTYPENVQKNYYTFDGKWKVTTASGSWQANSTLYSAGDTSPNAAYGNPTFTAQFTPITYTVTFDSNGGSVSDNITYTVESTESLPPSNRTGYTFAGWFVETADDDIWQANTAYIGTSLTGMHGNVTLKARWETITSTVYLDLDEGATISGNTQLTYSFDSSLTLNSPSKNGYTFDGWYVSAKSGQGASWVVGDIYRIEPGKTKVELPGGMLGDVHLVPVWLVNSYTLKYETAGGSTISDVPFNITSTIVLGTPVKNGYTFAGWSVSSHGDVYNWTASSYNAGQMLTGMYGNATLTANWTVAAYTVTFDPNGGTVTPSTRPYDIENGTPNLQTAAKNGYVFSGWKVKSAAADSSWIIGTMYNDALPANEYGNVTLEAVWVPQDYTLSFSDSDSKVYNITETFRLPTAVRTGYYFNHWVLTSTNGNWGAEGTVYNVSDTISGKYGDAYFDADFTPCVYSVQFHDANGAAICPEQSFSTGDSVTLPDYSKDGYTFEGWTVQTDTGNWGIGNNLSGTVTGKYGDVIFTPSLTPITYTITYLPDGGIPLPPVSYTIEDEITLGETTKTGHDQTGWVVDTTSGTWNAGDTFNAGATVTGKFGNVTLKATWTPKIYDITFITGQGEQTVHSPYGQETPNLPGDYSKPASAQYTYTFSHWEPSLARVTENATYTAVYTSTVNKYTVTWKVEQAENSGNFAYTHTEWEYGATPAFEGVPTQTVAPGADHRMRFTGWSPAIVPVTGNITYTAQFETVLNPQTVCWYNGETLLAQTEWGIGETPVYSGAVPTRSDANGYKFVFVGWATTDGGEPLSSLPAIVKGQDASYYASFERQPQSYTLTLDTDGGTVSGGNTVSYTYGGANTEISFPTPTKTGYSFTGWRVTETDGTWTVGEIYRATVLVDAYGTACLKAMWEKVTYTLTFTGTEITIPSMTYDIESTETLPDAEKEGNELIGWLVAVGDGSWINGTSVSVGESLTGKHGNATLAPVFRAKTYTVTWISGEIVQTVETLFGSAIYVMEPISRQGYTAEWDTSIPATMPAHDITFTAIYRPIEYYLRLNLNGGTGAESFYYTSDSDMLLPVPTREGATFVGWKVVSSAGNWNTGVLVPGGASLNGKYGSAILTAQWQLAIYTVTWIAGDETRVTRWYHGMTPSFDGTPYKSPDNNFSYVFSGWDKTIVPVYGDATYTALFTSTARIYTITWNIDGVTSVQTYSYGDTPVFDGETPARPSTSEYDFTFDGWSPAVSSVTDDVTYVAQFRVFVKLQGLSLNKSVMFLSIEGTEQLTADIYPATASVKDVIWRSSNEAVATVDALGRITATNAGLALISVESGDGNFKSYCAVSIAPRITTSVEVTAKGVSTTGYIGGTVQLYATVLPENATDRTFRWVSDSPSIASVDESGLVHFNSEGTTTIRAVTTDGFSQGTIEVTAISQSSVVEDKKTYGVRFLDIGCKIYLIDENGNKTTIENTHIITVTEGATIRFRPAQNYNIYINGVRAEQSSEYVLEDIHDNYIITASKAEINLPEDEDDAPTFLKKLQDFFRKIVQFFKNLFGKK